MLSFAELSSCKVRCRGKGLKEELQAPDCDAATPGFDLAPSGRGRFSVSPVLVFSSQRTVWAGPILEVLDVGMEVLMFAAPRNLSTDLFFGRKYVCSNVV